MSMDKLPKITKNNPTYNLMCDLKYSGYGEINKILNDIFTKDEIDTQYCLPKILVIGGESTGKSSLLENITKCRIFPRDSACCTKVPIKIILNNGEPFYSVTIKNTTTELKPDKIYDHLNNYLKSLNDIFDDEIIVNIHDKNYINMELFDLPGIRTYPPDKREKTVNLTKKYLNENNSIILCTIPAAETRIINQTSISLIKECKREDDTILVLTMIDRVQDEYMEECLFKRILKIDDEIIDLQIQQCIGVQNRSHKDKISLEKCDDKEMDNINYILDLIRDDNEYDEYNKYNKDIDDICSGLGIDRLIDSINKKYMIYVINTWIPKIVEQLKANIKLVENDIEQLGVKLNLAIVENLVNLHLFKILGQATKEIIEKYILKLKLFNDGNYPTYENLCLNSFEIKKYIEALQENDLLNEISKNSIFQLLEINSIDITNNEDNINVKSNYTNLNLVRYIKLNEKILMILYQCLTKNYGLLLENINNIIIIYQQQELQGPVNYDNIKHQISKFIISYLVYNSEFKFNFNDSDLEESSAYLEIRINYNKKISKFNNYIKKLLKITNEISN